MKNRSKTAPCDYCTPLGGFGWGATFLYEDERMNVRLGDKALHIEFIVDKLTYSYKVDITNCPMCGEAL